MPTAEFPVPGAPILEARKSFSILKYFVSGNENSADKVFSLLMGDAVISGSLNCSLTFSLTANKRVLKKKERRKLT